MKNWNASIQLNGDEESIFTDYSFEITNKDYNELMAAVSAGRPVQSCKCYDRVLEKAVNGFDLAAYLDLEKEKPRREDYDDKEEYKEAMADYKSMVESVWDNYSLEELTLEDPGTLIRFVDCFRGKKLEESEINREAFKKEYRFDYMDEKEAHYYLTVHYNSEGVITDITDVFGEALESESVRSSSYGECAPDYDFIACQLEECLADEGETEE